MKALMMSTAVLGLLLSSCNVPAAAPKQYRSAADNSLTFICEQQGTISNAVYAVAKITEVTGLVWKMDLTDGGFAVYVQKQGETCYSHLILYYDYFQMLTPKKPTYK